MPRLASLALVLCMTCTAPAWAQAPWDGTYDIATDGGQGTLTLQAGRGSISIAGARCVGGLEGIVTQTAADRLVLSAIGGAACDLTLGLSGGRVATISEGRGCTFYHGASCGFDGRTLTPAPAAAFPSFVPPAPPAAAPPAFPTFALQQQQPAAQPGFAGTWLCRSEVEIVEQVVILSPESVQAPGLGILIGIQSITPIGGNGTAWRIMLEDGEFAAMSEVGPGRMILSAPGDVMECRR